VYRCQEEALFAASLIIDTFRQEGDFESMEAWGQRIQGTDFCAGQVDLALIQEFMEEAETMRVGAIFRAAEDLFQAEDYETAALEYVRLVNQNPTSEFAPAALFNAAVGYERIQRFEPAMRMYQRIVDDYPACDFVNDALHRVAINSRRFFDFERATSTYLILAERERDEGRVRNALLAAAELQEYGANYASAALTYQDFAYRFPEDAAAPVALYRAGLMYERQRDHGAMRTVWERLRRDYGGHASTNETPIDTMVLDALRRTAEYYETEVADLRQARLTYEQVLREYADRRARDVDSRFAAGKARFYLANAELHAWEAIPIDGNLQRQRRVTQDLIAGIPRLLASFQEVVEIGSAEWTMAAYFMTGRIYQAFADKLYAVPVPDFGDPVMEEAYQLELEDFASAFEDEAVSNWRVAIELARRTGLVNEWTIAIIRELNRYLGAEFPLYKEAQEFVQRRVISPPPPLVPDVPPPRDLEIVPRRRGGGRGFDDGLEELDDLDDTEDDDGVDERPPNDRRRPQAPPRRDGFEEI
jgi:cellulose synthase operon protein C